RMRRLWFLLRAGGKRGGVWTLCFHLQTPAPPNPPRHNNGCRTCHPLLPLPLPLRRRPEGRNAFNSLEQPISLPWNCLNHSGCLGVIIQGLPQFGDAAGEHIIADKCISPDRPNQLFFSNSFSWVLGQINHYF